MIQNIFAKFDSYVNKIKTGLSALNNLLPSSKFLKTIPTRIIQNIRKQLKSPENEWVTYRQTQQSFLEESIDFNETSEILMRNKVNVFGFSTKNHSKKGSDFDFNKNSKSSLDSNKVEIKKELSLLINLKKSAEYDPFSKRLNNFTTKNQSTYFYKQETKFLSDKIEFNQMLTSFEPVSKNKQENTDQINTNNVSEIHEQVNKKCTVQNKNEQTQKDDLIENVELIKTTVMNQTINPIKSFKTQSDYLKLNDKKSNCSMPIATESIKNDKTDSEVPFKSQITKPDVHHSLVVQWALNYKQQDDNWEHERESASSIEQKKMRVEPFLREYKVDPQTGKWNGHYLVDPFSYERTKLYNKSDYFCQRCSFYYSLLDVEQEFRKGLKDNYSNSEWFFHNEEWLRLHELRKIQPFYDNKFGLTKIQNVNKDEIGLSNSHLNWKISNPIFILKIKTNVTNKNIIGEFGEKNNDDFYKKLVIEDLNNKNEEIFKSNQELRILENQFSFQKKIGTDKKEDIINSVFLIDKSFESNGNLLSQLNQQKALIDSSNFETKQNHSQQNPSDEIENNKTQNTFSKNIIENENPSKIDFFPKAKINSENSLIIPACANNFFQNLKGNSLVLESKIIKSSDSIFVNTETHKNVTPLDEKKISAIPFSFEVNKPVTELNQQLNPNSVATQPMPNSQNNSESANFGLLNKTENISSLGLPILNIIGINSLAEKQESTEIFINNSSENPKKVHIEIKSVNNENPFLNVATADSFQSVICSTNGIFPISKNSNNFANQPKNINNFFPTNQSKLLDSNEFVSKETTNSSMGEIDSNFNNFNSNFQPEKPNESNAFFGKSMVHSNEFSFGGNARNNHANQFFPPEFASRNNNNDQKNEQNIRNNSFLTELRNTKDQTVISSSSNLFPQQRNLKIGFAGSQSNNQKNSFATEASSSSYYSSQTNSNINNDFKNNETSNNNNQFNQDKHFGTNPPFCQSTESSFASQNNTARSNQQNKVFPFSISSNNPSNFDELKASNNPFAINLRTNNNTASNFGVQPNNYSNMFSNQEEPDSNNGQQKRRAFLPTVAKR